MAGIQAAPTSIILPMMFIIIFSSTSKYKNISLK
jgi:hypothetical protein